MSNLTDFFPSGGGGLTPKFQEFNASGTFTPTQALIDAGGYIEVFLVGGGGKPPGNYYGGGGAEVLIKKMYLTSTSGIAVSIASGAVSANSYGGNSTFTASSSGGYDLTAKGGHPSGNQDSSIGAGFSGRENTPGSSTGSGVLGYGVGGAVTGQGQGGGVWVPAANSGQGAGHNNTGGSGYCLIKWYE
jgi:hypothetical protein